MKTVFARELQEIENVSEPTLGAIEELGRKTENGYLKKYLKKERFFFHLVPRVLFPGFGGGQGKAPWGRGCYMLRILQTCSAVM